MSLEQSVDRLSGLIEQLTKQLDAGRSATAETPKADSKPPKADKAPSSGTTKTQAAPAAESSAPAATGASAPAAGLDYEKDVKPVFLKLAGRDMAKAQALVASYGPAPRLQANLQPEQYQDALGKINALLAEATAG